MNSENTRGEHQDTPTMKLPTILPIYLDYHATTPVDPRVAAVVLHAMTTAFGNANSTEHLYGEVAAALIVPLRTFQIHYREYTDSKNPPILHRKETFLPPDHPLRPKFARLTRQEERWGLYDAPERIGTREGWHQRLAEQGICLAGHRLIRHMPRS